jgi:hypothetical protein
MLIAVRQFRDWHLAHSLDTKAKARPDLAYLHGYEKTLLEQTIPILDDLYLGVCQTGFTWDDTRQMAQRYAKALWDGCQFEILE